jgi:hypothetical protein
VSHLIVVLDDFHIHARTVPSVSVSHTIRKHRS